MRQNSAMARDNRSIQKIIDDRIAEIGTSRAAVQRSAKVGSTYIRDLGDGDSHNPNMLRNVARIIGLSYSDLVGLEDPASKDADADDVIEVYSEPAIRRAITAALATSQRRDAEFFCDLVISLMKASAHEESNSSFRALYQKQK